jgi:hypothetical protein
MANVEMEKIADVIYEAPFAVMTHDRFSEGVKDEDSVFTYGNKACVLRSKLFRLCTLSVAVVSALLGTH